jgi:hypothetical protein
VEEELVADAGCVQEEAPEEILEEGSHKDVTIKVNGKLDDSMDSYGSDDDEDDDDDDDEEEEEESESSASSISIEVPKLDCDDSKAGKKLNHFQARILRVSAEYFFL